MGPTGKITPDCGLEFSPKPRSFKKTENKKFKKNSEGKFTNINDCKLKLSDHQDVKKCENFSQSRGENGIEIEKLKPIRVENKDKINVITNISDVLSGEGTHGLEAPRVSTKSVAIQLGEEQDGAEKKIAETPHENEHHVSFNFGFLNKFSRYF